MWRTAQSPTYQLSRKLLNKWCLCVVGCRRCREDTSAAAPSHCEGADAVYNMYVERAYITEEEMPSPTAWVLDPFKLVLRFALTHHYHRAATLLLLLHAGGQRPTQCESVYSD